MGGGEVVAGFEMVWLYLCWLISLGLIFLFHRQKKWDRSWQVWENLHSGILHWMHQAQTQCTSLKERIIGKVSGRGSVVFWFVWYFLLEEPWMVRWCRYLQWQVPLPH
jgi:hypothetical protein